MAFLSPLFMLGAAAAAIPIVLHLLHRETETRVKFSAVSMLKRGPVEESKRRHLRQLLLLALRVAALVLLAFAFARPFFTSRAAPGSGVRVVALDTSLSLSAPGQFERARQLAKDAINRASRDEAVAVVTFANAAHIVAPPGGDRSVALAAVDDAAAAFGATDYRAALNTVSEVLNASGAERATVVVVTDLQESGWSAAARGSLPESARVEVADVGAPPANLAVTNTHVDGDRGGQIVATIRSTDVRVREARVHLLVDGRQVAEATTAVGPNQSAEVTLTGARGVAAAIAVDDPGGIQGDNTRFLVLNNALNSAGRPPILLVTTNGDLPREAFYAEQALVAQGSDSAPYLAEGVAASALGSGDRHRLDDSAGVLLLSTRGLDQRGRDLLTSYLMNGGSILVAASEDVDGEALAEVLGAASFHLVAPADKTQGAPRTLAPADTRHPVFRVFGVQAAALGLIKFIRFARISGAGCQTLATFTTGEPALMDCTLGRGRALVFASDFGNRWNDFPLHATFVPFLHEAVKYLAGGRSPQDEYLVGEAPAGVPSKPGIATVPDGSGRAIRSIAVNVDPNESDPRRLTPEEFQAAVGRLKAVSRAQAPVEAQAQEDRQRIWQYVLALMVAVLVMESVLARRA